MLSYGEFIKKHGNEKVKFKGYYKYRFRFGNESGLQIYVGGQHEDIYKLEVAADKEYTVSDLEPGSAYIGEENIYRDLW